MNHRMIVAVVVSLVLSLMSIAYAENTSGIGLQVKEFRVKRIGSDLSFEWTVDSKKDKLTVKILADSGWKQIELLQNRDAKAKGTANVSVDRIDTGYHWFVIEVSDGTTTTVRTTEHELYIEQSKALPRVQGIRVGTLDGKAFIRWDGAGDASYRVFLYEDDPLRPLRSIDTRSDEYRIPNPWLKAGRYRVGVAQLDGMKVGAFDLYELIPSTPQGTVRIESSVVSALAVPVFFEGEAGATVDLLVGSEKLVEGGAPGRFDLHLVEGNHEITALVSDAHGNYLSYRFPVTVDRTPPVVQWNLEDGTKTGEETILLEGTAEAGAVVAINGVEQTATGGPFRIKIPLTEGQNTIRISAYDEAGNQSMHSLRIERQSRWVERLLMFGIPLLFAILLGIWYGFLNRRSKALPVLSAPNAVSAQASSRATELVTPTEWAQASHGGTERIDVGSAVSRGVDAQATEIVIMDEEDAKE